MPTPEIDSRNLARRAQDEEIAAEPERSPLDFPADTKSMPVEAHLGRRRRPIAVEGVVENGMVRPLDPGVKLPEHARVIIVASE